jgi:uncharacterized protein YjbI with pentapeptide repeats
MEAQGGRCRLCGPNAVDPRERTPGEGLCILHSKDPAKDRQAFTGALAEHRKAVGDIFREFVFPDGLSFHGTSFRGEARFDFATFSSRAIFDGATLHGEAHFGHATFNGDAIFTSATFNGRAVFAGATFHGTAHFREATCNGKADFDIATFNAMAVFIQTTFSREASFWRAAFSREAHFYRGTFSGGATFFGATFGGEADFDRAAFGAAVLFSAVRFLRGAKFAASSFACGPVDFSYAAFHGRMAFSGGGEEGGVPVPLFSGRNGAGVEVDFRQVDIAPPDALILRDADLRKCQFAGTELRKAELTGVRWPGIPGQRREGVYDELLQRERPTPRGWEHVERLHRELRVNYEDRRDYTRASDFHIGEKEMRRCNPNTPRLLRYLLTLYWLASGYGERYLRPLVCATLLLLASTMGYLALGVHPEKADALLGWANHWDWLRAAHYSLAVMCLLKPTDLVPVGFAKVVYTIDSLLGPLLLGLFALAIRQRLKR